MLNWLLVILLLLALVGIGVLAMIIDSGVPDSQKKALTYALFGLFGLIGVVFLLVEDKSAFVYGEWASQGKKGGKKSKQHYEESAGEGDAEQPEVEVTQKAGGSGDDGSGDGSGQKSTSDGRDCDVCPPMVALAGGNTVMGTLFRETGLGAQELGAMAEVKLEPFAISRYEITVGQFRAFLKAKGHKPANACNIGEQVLEGRGFETPGFEQTSEHPAVCVSWYDALAYADWLTQKTGRHYGLASEAQWEYAARAGGADAYSTGKSIHPRQAQFRAVGEKRNGTVEVGQFGANKFGLYDVHGNAAEMIMTCWTPAGGKAPGPLESCERRMIKGGAWYSPVGHLHAAARAPIGLHDADHGVGFRVVRHKE